MKDLTKKEKGNLTVFFSTKRFDTSNLWKHHILMYHWPDMEKSVSIINYFYILNVLHCIL